MRDTEIKAILREEIDQLRIETHEQLRALVRKLVREELAAAMREQRLLVASRPSVRDLEYKQ